MASASSSRSRSQLDGLSQKVLDDPKAHATTADTPDFWVLARAVNQYIKAEGKVLYSALLCARHACELML